MIDLNKVNVIDNLVPLHFQNYLYKKYTKNYFWGLYGLEAGTSYNSTSIKNLLIDKDNNIKSNIQEHFQFSNLILDTPKNHYNSEGTELFYLFHYLQISLNYTYNILPTRLKINLQTTQPNKNPQSHNTPHIDMFPPRDNSYTLIYYVNNSDGDTIIFNEKYEGHPTKNFTISRKISPRKGRAILFPTNQFHCGTPPSENRGRIVANLNFQLIPL